MLQGRQGTRQGGRETTKVRTPNVKGCRPVYYNATCVSYTLFFWLLVVPAAVPTAAHTTPLLHYSTTPLLHHSTTPLHMHDFIKYISAYIAPALVLSLPLTLSVTHVDCITIPTLPIKASVKDCIQQLFYALLTSICCSIQTNISAFSGECVWGGSSEDN